MSFSATDDIFETAKIQYQGRVVPAAALFFHENHFALRVEVPILGKEFTYGVYIGTDPEGSFFYNDTLDLDQPTKFTVSQVNNPFDNQPCAKVEFWYRDEDSSSPYATFLANDPTTVVTKTGFNGFDSSKTKDPYSDDPPKWIDLKLAQVSATVTKHSVGTKIVLATDVISKQATWTVDSDYFPRNTTVASHGTFSFKSLSKLNASDAGYADYSGDRIVFYNGRNATDYVAFFIPFEGYTSIQGGNNSLGDVKDKEFTGVTWN